MGDPKAVERMARFGIQSSNSFVVSVPKLRTLAREVGRDHQLALELWGTGLHDARLLASMVDDPERVTIDQMDRWVRDFDSWDVVEGSCGNLFDKTPFAVAKARERMVQGRGGVREESRLRLDGRASCPRQTCEGQAVPRFPTTHNRGIV